MVKPGAFANFGKILNAIYQNGFIVANAKMTRFSARARPSCPQKAEFYCQLAYVFIPLFVTRKTLLP